MIKNYFLVACRNLKSQKIFSFVNILGMALGMAGFALFALTAGVKLNADRFHKNARRIYGVVQVVPAENKDEEHTAFTPGPLLPALRSEIPEIENGTRVYPPGRMTIKHGDMSFYEDHVLFVDPSFFTVFSFDLVSGNPEEVLSRPYTIVMSEAAAFKYFGDQDPIGKVLTLNNRVDVTVIGITKDIPRTSSIRFEFLVSMETLRLLSGDLESWNVNKHATFVLLSEGTDRAGLNEKLTAVLKKYVPDSPLSPKKMYLFPFLDFRLKSQHITSFLPSSIPASVIIVLAFGAILLLVVCINFINLSTARYMHRTREVGIRKVIGARRSQLVAQFLGESVLMAFLALPLALLIYECIHPILTAHLGGFASLTFVSKTSNSIWNYPFLIRYLAITALLVGLFSGGYPALYLSKFRPIQVIQGSVQTGRKKRRGSKVMIVIQFTFSILFIAFAGLAKQQFDHLIKADFGYDRDNVAVVRLSGASRASQELIREELIRRPDVVAVSASADLPIVWETPRPARLLGAEEEEAVTVHAYGVDYEFTNALGIDVRRGRDFSRTRGDKNSFVISEAAVKKLRLDDAVGKQITVGEQTGTVIGVVEDFVFSDVGFEMPPSVLYLEQEQLNFMLVTFSSAARFEEIREIIKTKWLAVEPELPFDCFTLDDAFFRVFGLMNRIAGFLSIVGLTAVFFSGLGLLGLAAYMVERRTKEIGIRKVLGASLTRVMWTIIREFLVLVVISNVIGLSLIFFGWRRFLQTGVLFMTDIRMSMYVFVVFISMFTAALAVMSQTWKTVRANPVDSLRYE
jgi:putative ABC transport system permease protein